MLRKYVGTTIDYVKWKYISVLAKYFTLILTNIIKCIKIGIYGGRLLELRRYMFGKHLYLKSTRNTMEIKDCVSMPYNKKQLSVSLSKYGNQGEDYFHPYNAVC